MSEHAEPSSLQVEDTQVDVERLSRAGFVFQAIYGVGIAAGLGLLWVMEAIRNSYFHLLDRLNVKPRRHRRASAFPPGNPRTKPRSAPGV
jgi:hypothetical protein